MRTRIVTTAFVVEILACVLIPIAGCNSNSPTSANDPVLHTTTAPRDLVALPVNANIKHIEITEVGGERLDRIRRTPEMLNRSWTYRAIYRRPSDSQIEILLKVLRAMKAFKGSSGADICRGILFSAQEDGLNPFLSLYFDSTGLDGIVNDQPVKFEADSFFLLSTELNRLR